MMKPILSVSALALLAMAQTGWAQSDADATTDSIVIPVKDQMAADHAPLGIRAGSFLVIPKVDVEETYNDNIYATTNNEKSDTITTVRPQIEAHSNWSRHAVNALARGEFQKYNNHGDEDQSNYLAAVDGRLDVLRDTTLGGGVAYARNHEDRGDPNSIGSTVKPVAYDTTTARVGAFRGLGKLNARVDSQVSHIDYKNGYTSAGGVVNENVRDRNEYAQILRVGYQLDPRFEAFVRATFDTRAYDDKTTVTNRSNHGQTYVAGSTFDITGKTKGEVYAGATHRNYTDSALKDISTPVWGGKATWNADALTTVIGSIDRGVEETTIGASSGYVATDYDLEVQHSLTRDVLLHGNAGYSDYDYKGFAAGQRKDHVWSAGVGADYWLNRCLKTGLSYGYENRDSNITGGDYSRNLVLLRLTGTY